MSFDSTSTNSEFHTIDTDSLNSEGSTISLVIPPRGYVRPSPETERARVLERIQEVREQTEGPRQPIETPQSPFNWANIAGAAFGLARTAYTSYEDSKKRQQQQEWEARKNDQGGSRYKKRESSIPRGPDPPKQDWTKIPMRKPKYENPALKALAVQKEKDRIKRILELKSLGTTSFEAPDTPLPPYSPRVKAEYKIPEDIYEELEFKRLQDSMFAGDSDPEAARFKYKSSGKIYPTLPQDDYLYVEFGGLRRWQRNQLQSKSAREEKKRVKLASPSDSSDSEEEYAYVRSPPRLPLRLRGGAGSSSGSPVSTPSTKKRKTESELNISKKHEKEVDQLWKNNRTAGHVSATNDASPGMDANQIASHVRECRDIGREFSSILMIEKDKKKISVKALADLQAIQTRYQDLVDNLIADNSLMLGRLLEARSSGGITGNKKPVKKASLAEELAGLNGRPARDQTVVPTTSTQRKRIEPKKRISYADTVRFQDTVTTDTEAQTSDAFTVVTSKKKKRNKKKNIKPTSGTDSGTDTRRKKQTEAVIRKEKTDKLKKIEPPKTFTVGVGNATIGDVKKTLWSDLLRKIDSPNIVSTRIMPKGDIQIIPADNATYEALKIISHERNDMKQNQKRLPMVMIHDVDVTITGETLASTLAIQNHALGLSSDEAIGGIKPSFKRGPQGKETVHWVCMVKPGILPKLIGKKVFLGMSSCRITEYYDYNQCFKCLQYGHREKFCVSMFSACYHCAEKGHTGKECPNKDKNAKCINCKKNHEATSPLCPERIKAVDNVLRRTSYEIPQ